MSEDLIIEVIVNYKQKHWDQTIKLITKIFDKNQVKNELKIVLLNMRAESNYKLNYLAETVKDIHSSMDLGFKLTKDDELFEMYHHAFLRCKMDDTIRAFEQTKLACNINCDKEILIMKKMNVNAMFNKSDLPRERSQSADRRGRKV